jgi:hypothetical protein
MTGEDQAIQPSNNHFKGAALAQKVAREIQAKGLRRVAGNVYICKSTQDFWNVVDGKIVRLTKTEVDNGENLRAAPRRNPNGFMDQILNDLTF